MCLLPYEGVVEGYSKKYIKENLWRIRKVHEFEDALQESYIVYDRVRTKYEDVAVNEAHFMALYKASLHNWLMTEVKKSMRRRDSDCMCDWLSKDGDVDNFIDSSCNTNLGELELRLRKTKTELSKAVQLLFGSPDEFLDISRAIWLRKGNTKAFGAIHLRKTFGINVNFEKALRRTILEKNVRVRKDIRIKRDRLIVNID